MRLPGSGPLESRIHSNALLGPSFCISQLKAKMENRSTPMAYLVSKVDRFVGVSTFAKCPHPQCTVPRLVLVRNLVLPRSPAAKNKV
jgi:hypothetical protein